MMMYIVGLTAQQYARGQPVPNKCAVRFRDCLQVVSAKFTPGYRCSTDAAAKQQEAHALSRQCMVIWTVLAPLPAHSKVTQRCHLADVSDTSTRCLIVCVVCSTDLVGLGRICSADRSCQAVQS
jgi:hypothetical protein